MVGRLVMRINVCTALEDTGDVRQMERALFPSFRQRTLPSRDFHSSVKNLVFAKMADSVRSILAKTGCFGRLVAQDLGR